MDAYLEAIVKSTGPLARSVKVAKWLNGTVPGPFMSQLLDKMGVEHVDLYCDWDATDNHGADPTRPKNMVDLGKAVVDNGCEFGLGADGDGDGVGAVDEEGRFIYPDRLIALLAEDLLKDEDELPEDAADDEHLRIVYDVKCSMNVEQAIFSRWTTGDGSHRHSFMKRCWPPCPNAKWPLK